MTDTICSVPFHAIEGDVAYEQLAFELYARQGLDGVGLLDLGARAEPCELVGTLYGTLAEITLALALMMALPGATGSLVRPTGTVPVRVLSVGRAHIRPVGTCTIATATHRLDLPFTLLHEPTV